MPIQYKGTKYQQALIRLSPCIENAPYTLTGQGAYLSGNSTGASNSSSHSSSGSNSSSHSASSGVTTRLEDRL